MELIKCGLCGFEFERGLKICRGCHGEIRYGAGAGSLFGGVALGVVVFFLLRMINNHLFNIADAVGLYIILGAFVVGTVGVLYLGRNAVRTEKRKN